MGMKMSELMMLFCPELDGFICQLDLPQLDAAQSKCRRVRILRMSMASGEDMNRIKSIAIIVAIMMVGVVVSTNVMIVDDSDASGSIGTTKFYYMENTTAYSMYTATGFNASDAICGQTALLSVMKSTVDNNYDKEYVNDYGPYVSINDEWGKITRTSDISEGYVWNVFVYTYDGENDVGQWKEADLTLGFYKPFADYDESYATANIALYYGPALTTIPAVLPTAGLQDLTAVTENDTFKMSFEFTYLDANDHEVYFSIDGYGSDAALALIDAIGDDAVVVRTPGLNYGYVVSIFGLATTQNDDGSWSWWNMFNDNSEGESDFSDFYLGFYIPMSGFDLTTNLITFYYE